MAFALPMSAVFLDHRTQIAFAAHSIFTATALRAVMTRRVASCSNVTASASMRLRQCTHLVHFKTCARVIRAIALTTCTLLMLAADNLSCILQTRASNLTLLR